MLTSPNVQLKAQNEIDNDIGTTRLPEYDDRELLPYVEAIFEKLCDGILFFHMQSHDI
ncbi:hypothetical protein BDQ17DRAFT_1266887 [Cyathus striatus]|nr:hypothetical protein BDQ17DRAFT_1266887 [Cyathus striatus]